MEIVHPSCRRKLFLLPLGAFIAAIVFLAGGCGDTVYMPHVTGTTPLTATMPAGVVNKQFVEDMIVRKMGNRGLRQSPMVRDVRVTREADGLFVDMDVSRLTECVGVNCIGDNPGRVMQETVEMTQQFMSALFQYPDVSRVQMNVFGNTDNPGDENNPATRVMFTRARAGNFDWFTLTPNNIQSKADDFWAAPNIAGYLAKQPQDTGTSTSIP